MKERINRIISMVQEPEFRILPGNLAYSFFLAIIPIIAAFCSWKAFKYSRRPELVGDGRANKRAGLLILSIVWLAPALFALFAIVGP